jgi:uncharacterized metal-binding protein YceD (DUF177 family)
VSTELAWSHPLIVADIPEEGEEITLAPDEATRTALARLANVIAMPALSAQLRVMPDGTGGAVVTGTLDATVRQTCVVSLDPFDNKVHEDIALAFAPEGAQKANLGPDIELDEGELSDSIKDGIIDLGAVVTEFLLLGIDPYPKKPGAVFTPVVTAKDESENPFAALAKLKKKSHSAE